MTWNYHYWWYAVLVIMIHVGVKGALDAHLDHTLR
jgi:hypothetical protein